MSLPSAVIVLWQTDSVVVVVVPAPQDIRDVTARIRLTVSSLDDLIEVMNQQNYILRKGGGLYQLQTSTYSQVCPVSVVP